MAKWKPCKRRDFIKKLKNLSFKAPEPGGRHFYMRYGTYTLTLPSNKEFSVPQLRMLLHEIELGTNKKISLEEWGAFNFFHTCEKNFNYFTLLNLAS